jgi:hypothetical protein
MSLSGGAASILLIRGSNFNCFIGNEIQFGFTL